MDTKTNFIALPNGDSLHRDTIKAIRLGDPRPGGKESYESELKPRVIVDFVIGEHGKCIVVECDTVEARNLLALELREQCATPT